MSDILPRHRVEATRLDQIQAAAWEQALYGDTEAIDTVRRVMERQAQLFGLDEIQTQSSDQASITATGVPGTVVTLGGLAELVREFSRQFNWHEPRPARLKAGSWVIRLFQEMVAKPGQPPWNPPALPTLYAVPIEPDDGDPFRWRLIGTDGEVMQEGWIAPSVLDEP